MPPRDFLRLLPLAVAFSLFVALAGCASGPAADGGAGGGSSGAGTSGGGRTGAGTAGAGAMGGGTPSTPVPQLAWTSLPPLALVVGDMDAIIAASVTAPKGDSTVPSCAPTYAVAPPGVAVAITDGGVTVLHALDSGTALVTADCASDAHYAAATALHNMVTIGRRWEVTTLAGSGDAGSVNDVGTLASFNFPVGVAVDDGGYVYVADASNNLIRKITPSGQVTTLAGSGNAGRVEDAGTLASFNLPRGVAVDGSGTVYVADTNNHLIRKITASGQVTTLAGSGDAGSVNDVGTLASLNYPYGVAVDASGTVYVADTNNHLIRKITASAQVTTLAGSGDAGSVNDIGTLASFNYPFGVAVDGSGTVYVADNSTHLIRKITPSGQVTTLAGSGNRGSVNDVGTQASFSSPSGVAVDAAGYVYVADYDNSLIRKVTPSGQVTTLAGGGLGRSVNDAGTLASFNYPYGVAVDASGNVYVADSNNHLIRKISAK